MSGFSSFAPHLGAALGAGLMLAAAVAFNAGAGGAAMEDAAARASQGGVPEAAMRTVPAPSEAVSLQGGAREAATVEPAVPSIPSAAVQGPRLAVILDDVADIDAAERALALAAPVTVAVLPYAEDAPDIAARVTAAGGELFVHLPMEPVGLDDPGPYALTKALDSENLAARLAFAFARAPGAVGFNNHMGSRMTADRAAMDAVFAALDPALGGLVFVDSLTHPRSQAAAAAGAAGLTALKRDVFLDHDRDPAVIDAQIEAALALAVERGSAIAIAHPRPETFAALETLAARAEAAGVQIVAVSVLVAP
jgi:polysaccharide deacetylase 2 family uncharacterized protein YibQ